MRHSFFVAGHWLAISCCWLMAPSLDAATIEGRVVDSSGNPIAGAEVRIWQKLTGPDGRVADRPVDFDGSEVLQTDADGRFASPDALVEETFARIVAEAEGMLAGRSGWIEIAKNLPVQAPDITLSRLRVVTGQVRDRRGRPIDGAAVFNVGDGHERVETTSKGGGKFRLADVPVGGVFLFAEMPGYRFTGVHLPAEETEATLRLTSLDEAADPLPTLPPLLSPQEEEALAREVLDPWLERLAKSGAPQEKIASLASLIGFDVRQALKRLERVSNPQRRNIVRDGIIAAAIAQRERISWDELRTIIEAGDDQRLMASQLVKATEKMDDSEQAQRLEWLEAALRHARNVEDPALRTDALAWVADRFFSLGETAKARRILAEAEQLADPLFSDHATMNSFALVALAAVHDDVDRAIGWIDRTQNARFFPYRGGELALRLAAKHPRKAVELWNRIVAAEHAPGAGPVPWMLYVSHMMAADFCYRLAVIDLALADRVADDARNAAIRIRQKGAIAFSLARSQPAEARKRFESLVRDELPRRASERFSSKDGLLSYIEPPPTQAAWLLPLAEQVAPDLCGELFWRSLALRSPRPTRDWLDDQIDEIDIQLAKMLARYDRSIARALLEPLSARLPEIAAPAATGLTLGPAHASQVATMSRQSTQEIISGAVHVDPRWAKSLLDAVPAEGAPLSPADAARQFFVSTLARHGAERWKEGISDNAGFWEPSAQPATADRAENDTPAGIGVALGMKDGRIIVARVLPDSPAAASEVIGEGDHVVAVGQGEDTPVETQGRRLAEVVAMVRGKKDTVVRLTIAPAGKTDEEATVVTLARGTVKALNLFGQGKRVEIGSRAPPLSFTRFGTDGKRNLSDYRGKVVVLTFWASWCGPCKKVVDTLLHAHDDNPGWRGRVVVLALSVDESQQAAAAVCKDRGWNQALVGWCGAQALKTYDISGIPSTFVIGGDGKVLALGDSELSEIIGKHLD